MYNLFILEICTDGLQWWHFLIHGVEFHHISAIKNTYIENVCQD